MNGDEDLGEDITMKGDKFHFAQNSTQAEPVLTGEPEKVVIIDPKIAKAHTTFYNNQKSLGQEGPEVATPTSSVGEPEKVVILDPKIAKAHTTFYHGQQN